MRCLVIFSMICLAALPSVATAQQHPKPNARTAAFVYDRDVAAARSFDKLLRDHGFNVELIDKSKIERADWKNYGLVVIASEFGRRAPAADDIARSDAAILALGEGGYYFLGQLKQPIGSPRGWHGKQTDIHATDADFWEESGIDLSKDRRLELYASSGHVGIHLPRAVAKVTLIGREVANETHYPVVQYDSRFMLWGFTGSPEVMTDTGKVVFVHACKYLAGPAGPMPEVALPRRLQPK